MPYKKAPVNDTYSSVQISAVQDINLRYGGGVSNTGMALGSYMENLIPRKIKVGANQELVASPSYNFSTHMLTGTTVPRGVFVWQKSSGSIYYFVVVNNKVWTSTDNVTYTAVTTLTTSANTPVGFCEFISSTNVKSLVLVDGVEGYVFSSNAAGTKITDADFPTPHVPNPVFIDGYLFLAKASTGDIYNCDLNDPSAWTAGSYISSEVYPDDLRALVKVNNYLVAVGQTGCEYFYDAANATGSPLARYEGATLPFGTVFPNSIASSKDSFVMLANNGDGSVTVKFVEGFKFKDITPSWLDPTLQPLFTANAQPFGYFLRMYGQLLYVLRFATTSLTDYGTAAYCFDSESWVKLGFNTATASFALYPLYACAGPSNNASNFVAGFYENAPYVGFSSPTATETYFYTNGTSTQLYRNSPRYVFQMDRLTFGTMNSKAMNRLAVAYNNDTSNTTYTASETNTNIEVLWSDNDSALSTSGTNYRQLPINVGDESNTTFYGDFPIITQLGMFRQRTIRISYGGDDTKKNLPLTFKGIEVDINKGQQ